MAQSVFLKYQFIQVPTWLIVKQDAGGTLRNVLGGCPPYLSLIHISEPTRRTPISYAVFCLKKKFPEINYSLSMNANLCKIRNKQTNFTRRTPQEVSSLQTLFVTKQEKGGWERNWSEYTVKQTTLFWFPNRFLIILCVVGCCVLPRAYPSLFVHIRYVRMLCMLSIYYQYTLV